MFCCSLGSQLFCAKTAAQEFALVRERMNPITTLNESTLCSKIETHRRQIKTRKTKSNEKSCTNRLMCRTYVYVCEYKSECCWISTSWKCFYGIGWLCWQTLGTHSTDFTLNHALHVIFRTQLFGVSFPDFQRLLVRNEKGRKKRDFPQRFSMSKIKTLAERRKKWQEIFALPQFSLILQFFCNHKWKIFLAVAIWPLMDFRVIRGVCYQVFPVKR